MEIEELAKSIDDITDPSSFDKVLIYFEELENEIEEYMQLLVETLQFEEITWDRPWYQDIISLTKAHQPYYERNKHDLDKFRTDKISKEECDMINKNWRKLTRKYKVPDKLRYFASWRNKKTKSRYICPEEKIRRFVTAYLARGLQRTIQQVFMYIRDFSLDKTEAKYNEHEEKIINVCLMHEPKKAPPILSIVLGRHPRGLYKRRTVLKTGKKEKKRIKWNLEQATKLLKLLQKHAELPIDELKYKMFEKSLWMKMEDEMDRDYTHLHYFWYCYLHVQLFVKTDVKLYKLRKRVLKLLRDSHYRVWSDIKWNDIMQHFPDGFTAKFLYTIVITVVRQHPSYLKIPLHDLAMYGLQTIKHKKTDKRLRNLTLNEEGNLEVIKYTTPKEDNA